MLKLWTPLLLKVQTRTTLEQNMMPIKNKRLHTIKKITITTRSRSSRSQMFVKIGVRKGLQACNLNKKSLQHRCFPMDFAKFIRTAFLWNTSGGCFWRMKIGTWTEHFWRIIWVPYNLEQVLCQWQEYEQSYPEFLWGNFAVVIPFPFVYQPCFRCKESS